LGSLQHSPDLAGFEGPTSKGRDGKVVRKGEEGGQRKGRQGIEANFKAKIYILHPFTE